MNDLPYFIPDDELDLNISILIIIFNSLERTNRGKLIINNENLIIFIFLIKNPIILNELLHSTQNELLSLNDCDIYNIENTSKHMDFLYDYEWLKVLLKYASKKGIISVLYRKNTGFMYVLTDKGKEIYKSLSNNNFLKKIQSFALKMKVLQQYKVKDLKILINKISENI